MKNIILLLVFAFFGEDVFCDEDFFSKFHQHAFKIKDVRIQLMSYNKSYFNFFEIKAFKYNRTATAHNVTVNLKVNVSDRLEIIVQGYKFLSNEYRHFPARFQVNAKKSLETNLAGFRDITKCGNFTAISFHKDITYHGCNFMLDESHFPPLIPNGKYIAELTFLLSNNKIALVNVYNEVYTPTEYPKY